MMENHGFSEIIGNTADAPFINQLAANGAMMAQSFAEVHPSEPNYYALFAGNTLVKENVCPVNAGNEPNLGSQLLAAGYSFNRFFFEGRQFSDNHLDRVDVGNGPFLSLRLDIKF